MTIISTFLSSSIELPGVDVEIHTGRLTGCKASLHGVIKKTKQNKVLKGYLNIKPTTHSTINLIVAQ